MAFIKERSSKTEWMDEIDIHPEELFQTLQELDIINSWLGGYRTSMKGLKALLPSQSNSISILDIACGGGEFTNKLYEELRETVHSISITGIDINPVCIQYAQEKQIYKSVRYWRSDVFDLEQDQQYDVIHASLFFHHLRPSQIVSLLNKLKNHCKYGIVINDLHRNCIAYETILSLTKLFSKNRLIRHDAPLSVLRGFQYKELVELINNTAWEEFEIKWCWAFRWMIILRKQKKNV